VLVTSSELERNDLSADAAIRLSVDQSKVLMAIAHPDGARQYPRPGEHAYGRSGMVAGNGASRARTVTWFGDEFMVTQTTRAGALEPDRTEYAEGWLLQDDGSLRIEIVDNRSENSALRRTGVLVYRRK
jgi:hypothetical protein